MTIRAIRLALSFTIAVVICCVLIQMSVHPIGVPNTGFVTLHDLPGENIIFAKLEKSLDLGFIEPGIRVGVGLVQVLLAALILLPNSRKSAAVWVALIFAIMISLQLSPLLGTNLPLENGTELTALDNGANFLLHILLFSLALLLTAIDPR